LFSLLALELLDFWSYNPVTTCYFSASPWHLWDIDPLGYRC